MQHRYIIRQSFSLVIRMFYHIRYIYFLYIAIRISIDIKFANNYRIPIERSKEKSVQIFTLKITTTTHSL